MPTLYQIVEDLVRLDDMLESGTIDQKTYEDTLDAYLKDATAEKLQGYCKAIYDRQARSDAKANEIKRLQQAKAVDENAIKSMKDRLGWFLDATNRDKADAGVFKVAWQGNGGSAPLEVSEAVHADPSLATHDGQTYYELVLDEGKIRKALEEGVELPFASLLPRGRHVRIR